MLSILTPAFNEATNLEAMYARVVQTVAGTAADWEWLIVDDHSRDDTFAVVQRLAQRDPRVRGVRLARNVGSHVAILCGLHHVRGEVTVTLAADLQDPPEVLRLMLARWRAGARVVWAARRRQPGTRAHAGFAAFYYWIMRRVVGMSDMPPAGADFFLIDRVVVEALRRIDERHVNVFALIMSLGYPQDYVEYDKQERASGRSGWTIRRKVKLVADSVIGFSAAPIRGCGILGGVLLALGVVLLPAGAVAVPAEGAALVVLLGIVVGLAGVQLLALAIIGEYVWRALDEVRRRPAYLVEAVTLPVSTAGAGYNGRAREIPETALE